MNGGASAACWPAVSSISAMSRRPIEWCAMPLFPPIYIIVPNITSWAARSRSAFSMIREPRFSILPMSMKARPTRSYWRGRAAEAASLEFFFFFFFFFPTAYYGQLARARLGLSEIALRPAPPQPVGGARHDLLQATGILYVIGEFDLALSFVSDLAETSSDVVTLSELGQLTARYYDAQASWPSARSHSQEAADRTICLSGDWGAVLSSDRSPNR